MSLMKPIDLEQLPETVEPQSTVGLQQAVQQLKQQQLAAELREKTVESKTIH